MLRCAVPWHLTVEQSCALNTGNHCLCWWCRWSHLLAEGCVPMAREGHSGLGLQVTALIPTCSYLPFVCSACSMLGCSKILLV